MNIKSTLKRISPTFLLVIMCIALALGSGYLWYNYIHTRSSIISKAKGLAKKDSLEAANKLEQIFQELKNKVTLVADYLSQNKITREQLEKLLDENSSSLNLGVMFAPYAFDPQKELYAPYAVRIAEKKHLVQLESVYDYTKTLRYTKPLAGKSGFGDSYLDMATNTLIIEYCAPFYDEKGQLAGIAFASYEAPDIKRILDELAISRKGFVSITEEGGNYLYHPNNSYMIEDRSVVDLEEGNQLIVKLMQDIAKGKSGFLEGTNTITDQASWIFYAPLKGTPWTFISTFVVDDLGLFTKSLQRDFTKAIFSSLLLLVFLVFLGMQLYQVPSLYRYWISSLIVSASCIVGIIVVWYLARTSSYVLPHKEIIIDSQAALKSYINDLTKDFHAAHGGRQFGGFILPNEHPEQGSEVKEFDQVGDKFSLTNSYNQAVKDRQFVEIPTGVYISEIDLNPQLGVNKVKISGIIWQRFKRGSQDNIVRGVLFPQALESDVQELYNTRLYNEDLVAWRFMVTLIQDFDNRNYPFDEKNIKIRIFSKDFSKALILVPDLAAYKILAPTALAQLGAHLRSSLPEWRSEKSFFFFQDIVYLTNFGYYTSDSVEFSNRSEGVDLFFNVTLRRFIASTLLLTLIPIITILMLLFLVLMLAGLGKLKIEHILASIASLFFTVMLAYNRFYTDVPVQYNVFLGTFYQMVEVSLFVVAVITIMYLRRITIPVISYDNMLIPKLLYWPTITAWCLMQSLLYFY